MQAISVTKTPRHLQQLSIKYQQTKSLFLTMPNNHFCDSGEQHSNVVLTPKSITIYQSTNTLSFQLMKILFIAIVFVLSSVLTLKAQDIITTNEGKDIQAKILEVTPTEVKYKKFNNLDGPTFTMLKSDILIVRYENGENDVFTNTKHKSNTTETVIAGMKYREYKKYYDTKYYVPDTHDPYSRGWAGVASLFIPGLGQAIDGEWGRGAIFFLGNVGLGVIELSQRSWNEYFNRYEYSGVSYVALAARVALNIWSICDAVHVAKVKNMYYQDIRGQRASVDLKVEPFFAYTPTGIQNSLQPTAGLSVKFMF